MIKLDYPARNTARGASHLNFESWQEYWKTLGYLSNPNVHKENNRNGNIKITYENNELDGSYTGTPRIHYYGNVARFEQEFPSLHKIARSPRGSEKFRINRKEFGETLIDNLGFEKIDFGLRDDLILPPDSEVEILNRISDIQEFDIDAWNEGYNLGNLY